MEQPGRRTLEASLPHLLCAPASEGSLVLVVRRPGPGRRELLDEATLDLDAGVLGDDWLTRATSRARAEGRHLDAQVTVMSARMVALLAPTPQGQALAGDQLYVDLDLSQENLPTGSQLAFGDPDDGGVVLEVTAKPHNGCAKFGRRFGEDALAFVNSETGRRLRLRGLNARVVTPGLVRPGDPVARRPRN